MGALVYQISFQTPETARLTAGGYSDALVTLVQQLLNKEPQLRPSAHDLLEPTASWSHDFSLESSELLALEAFAWGSESCAASAGEPSTGTTGHSWAQAVHLTSSTAGDGFAIKSE